MQQIIKRNQLNKAWLIDRKFYLALMKFTNNVSDLNIVSDKLLSH